MNSLSSIAIATIIFKAKSALSLRCLACWQDDDWVNKVASQSVKLPISNAACKFITIRQSPVAFDLINQLKLECVSQCWLIGQKKLIKNFFQSKKLFITGFTNF